MFDFNRVKLFRFILVIIISSSVSFSLFAVSPAPLDGNGKPVDWWVILKMPKLTTNDLSSDGTSYYFASSKASTPVYQLKADNVTPKSIENVAGNPVAQTLQCMFDAMNKPGDVSYIVYNDEKPVASTTDGVEMMDSEEAPSAAAAPAAMYPDGKTPPSLSQYGHLKGMLVWDNDNAYWLVHSAPKFAFTLQAPGPYSYVYPQNALVKGQSFICFSFKTDKYLKTIANQLLYSKPLVLQSYISDNSKSESWYNTVNSIINKKWNKEAPNLWEEMTWDNLDTGSSIVNLETVGGVTLFCFAKNAYWNNDIYSYLVSPFLKVSLYAETWRCGCTLPNFYKNVPPKAYHNKQMVDISIWKRSVEGGSNSSGSYVSRYYNLKYPNPPYDTVNVTNINIDDKFVYKYTLDHSKWAISQDSKQPIVFIGDMNRQGPHSQWIRGGGGIAMKNDALWTFFKGIISATEPPAASSAEEAESL